MSNVFLVVVFLASVIYISMKYKPALKHTSAGRAAAAVLPSLILIVGAMFLIYFGNNWISGMLNNVYVIVFVQFFFVLLILSICTFIINLLFKKAFGQSERKTV